MESDGAMTPEDEPPCLDARQKKRRRLPSRVAAKTKRPKRKSKRKRKRSSSSSSTLLSSSAASRSDTDSTQSKGKQKGGLHSTDILKLIRSLQGLAKRWFESLPSVVFSWSDWQVKLKKGFPNEQNYGRLLEEMLIRTTKNNENLRDYYYDKLTLLNSSTKVHLLEAKIELQKCLKIRILSDNEIQMSGLIEAVTVDPNYSGDIFIEGYCNSEPSKEYYLHRGAYRVDNGKCLLGVTNLSHEKLILLKKGNLIARATPIIEKAVKHISKLSTELPNYEPILIADIKIGTEVDNETNTPDLVPGRTNLKGVIAVDRIRPWININIPDQNHDENEITDSSSSVSENELDKNIE
ncbi:hypothetical protein ACJJTC_019308 [Scirpophaga incertulas]